MIGNYLNSIWRERLFTTALLGAIAVPMLITLNGFFILAKQLLNWLRTGDWTPRPLHETVLPYFDLAYPQSTWWAGQNFIDFFMNLPASISLAVGGFVLTLIVVLALCFVLDWLGLIPADKAAGE